MLLGEDFGRRHQCGLAAGLDRRRHREQRYHRLAAADIALQHPHHARRRRHVPEDLRQRRLLGTGQGERQGIDDFPAPATVAGQRPAPEPPLPLPHQRQRELGGQHLVIGEADACDGLRQQIRPAFRPMRPLQGSAPVRPLPLRQQVFVNPFGKFGRPVQRAVDRPLDDFLCQTLGQGIDRLHRPDAVGVLEGGDEIRMGHLPAAAEFVDPAADDPDLADRIGYFEPVRFRVEETPGS